MPTLDAATEAALRASIAEFGVKVPVLVDQHGRIIDGHHRIRIASELGVPCESMVVVVDDDEHAMRLAAELNLVRRHMTRDVLRAHVEILVVERGMILTAVAKALGVSYGTVWNAKQLISPDKLPKGAVGRDGKVRPRKYDKRPLTLKEYRTERRRDELAAQRQEYDTAPTYRAPVRIGDFREVFADLEPGSVDLILTDPPYGRRAVPLYTDLAVFAARVLKPGGSLIAYAGQSTLHEVIPNMAEHLRYWWTICLLQGSPTPAIPGVGVFVGWKPILWFVNGGTRVHPRMLNDVIKSERPPDQTTHRWAQSVAQIEGLIESLTDPGDLIVDPFAGTAAWGAFAQSMNRRWLGSDLGGAVIP
ncbi:DNA methyltransferase [Cellulomonas xylanilytica]|nr:DNA methyltransferase [Cellulomonas xylanilytica]